MSPPLPEERDATLAPGTQIPSALLNTLQDMIVGARHGSIRRVVGAAFAEIIAGTPGDVSVSGDRVLGPGDGILFPMPVHVGEVIEDVFITFAEIGAGTDFMVCALLSGGSIVGGPTNSPFPSGSSTRFEMDALGGEQTVVSPVAFPHNGSRYDLSCGADGGNAGGLRVEMIDFSVRK